MTTDTTVTPEKKLTGAALAAPGATVGTTTREQELLEEFKSGLDPASATALTMQVEALTAAQAGMEEEIHLLTIRAETAEASYDEQKTLRIAAEKKAAAKVTRAPAPARPRKIEAPKESLAREELQFRLAGEELIEIVLSDGAREVAGIDPIVVSGDVWREHPLGLLLREPVTIEGPAPAGATIAGYGLLIGGKVVAYTERSEPLKVTPGQKMSLADDIYF
jgi:hypothetical protein